MASVGVRDRRFPRPGGVIVPAAVRPLARAGGVDAPDADDPLLDQATRQAMGHAVVRATTRNLQRLDAATLATPFPSPDVVLRTFVLDDRTRCALERLRPAFARVTDWTIGRYLDLPKFGAHCLIDLLAAREEATRAPVIATTPQTPARAPDEPVAAVDDRRLDEVTALLARRVPCTDADLADSLREAGLASVPVTVRALAAIYRRRGVSLPIQVARHRGSKVVVPAGTVGVATTVISTAVRFVADWGMATVQSIGDRARALRGSSVAREIAGRVVMALPSFLWIDEVTGWFTLQSVRSRFTTAIRQTFAIADRIQLDELGQALAKRRARIGELPLHLLSIYLRAICDCSVSDGWVYASRQWTAAPLSLAERTVAAILARAGRELGAATLQRQAAEQSIGASALQSLLDQSPLFLRTPSDGVRLIGAGSPSLALG